MREIGKIVRKLRVAKGYTLEDLAGIADFDAGNLSRFERGLQGIAPTKLELLAKGLDTTVSNLYKVAEGSADNLTTQAIPSAIYQNCPIRGVAQPDRDGYWGTEAIAADSGEYLNVPSTDPDAYALQVRGDSLAPVIRDGWFVIIEPSAELRPGEYVLVRLADGRSIIKELLWIRDTQVSLMRLNDAAVRITLHTDEIDAIHPIAFIAPPSKKFQKA